jgi:predicted NUDIX family phosphoesterase
VCLNRTDLEESVFAIPTEKLWKLLTYKETGSITGSGEVLNRIVQHGLFRRRSELEEDPSFKQVIPYAIISSHDSFFVFRRISGQAEKRLHNKLHMGVGGHMNPGSSKETGEQYLISELKREFFEEVRLLDACVINDIEFIGFINDDSIPVGRVHIGLLYIIRLSNQNIVVNETDKMTGEWIDRKDISGYYEEMETWTKIAMDHLLK